MVNFFLRPISFLRPIFGYVGFFVERDDDNVIIMFLASCSSTRSAPQVLNKQMGSMNSPGGMFGSAEPFPMPFDMVGL